MFRSSHGKVWDEFDLYILFNNLRVVIVSLVFDAQSVTVHVRISIIRYYHILLMVNQVVFVH